MLIAIVGMAIGILFLYIAFLGFEQGVRLGMQTANKEVPEPIKSPVNVIQEVVEAAQGHKESKEQAEANKAYNEGLSAILNYTGDVSPKEE